MPCLANYLYVYDSSILIFVKFHSHSSALLLGPRLVLNATIGPLFHLSTNISESNSRNNPAFEYDGEKKKKNKINNEKKSNLYYQKSVRRPLPIQSPYRVGSNPLTLNPTSGGKVEF